jgi:hypothetical protein
MRSEPDGRKCGKMQKICGKCGLNFWDLEKLPFVLTVVREMGN